MTDQQAIRAAIRDASAWHYCRPDTAIGLGCKMQADDTLAILEQCPTGAAAMRGEAETVTVRGKARNRPKSSRGIGQESRGRKTRGDGRVTGGDAI